MDSSTFIITVYCFVDDEIKALMSQGVKLRSRGGQPKLSDSEVITMEMVGEFLGIDTDKNIYLYFRRHYGQWFPALLHLHRTSFVRQAANLWKVKERLWQELLKRVQLDPAISIIDSFPVPVCRFARAYRCKKLRGFAKFGFDDVDKQHFFGLRGHVRVCWPGLVTVCCLESANTHDTTVAEALLDNVQGYVLGDRNYWKPDLAHWLVLHGIDLVAPYKFRLHDKQPWPRWLTNTRRRIETVIGQFVERYHAKKVWARDIWHVSSRWLRKLLSHTFAVFLCQQQGLDPLKLAELVTD